jgi:S1-C subfamily serine protease
VVPERIITPPLDLYSSQNKTLENGDQLIRVTKIDKNGDFSLSGGTTVLTREKYQQYLNSANAVFEMIPSQFGTNEEKMSRRGTAFSIGNNLLLTNLHVLDPNFQNTTECDDFEIKNYEGEKFECKKVHYCDVEQDVCLIEMKNKTKTKRDCLFCRGIKYDASLANGPSLKLSSVLPEMIAWDNTITTAIGNSAGLGIHYSQGRGLFLRAGQLRFYAPITTGNSGGPLLNESGKVIGIVKRQTAITLSSDPNKSYNIANPVGDFIRSVRENLENQPEVLEKFNSSVVE